MSRTTLWRKMKEYGLCVVTALFFSGCAAPPPIDVDAELLALRDAAEAYHAAAGAKDTDAVVGMYDQSAIMAPPNADLVEGLDSVRNYRFGFIETRGVELEFELVRAEVSVSGDIAWTLAIGEITINQPEGPPGRDQVRDFHTWKKQADGSWKVVVDVWNSGLPAGG
jgi:ketosteroid isomerase-like protein